MFPYYHAVQPNFVVPQQMVFIPQYAPVAAVAPNLPPQLPQAGPPPFPRLYQQYVDGNGAEWIFRPRFPELQELPIHKPVEVNVQEQMKQSDQYNPLYPGLKHPNRFHVSLYELDKTVDALLFGRTGELGASIVEILRGGPKVYQAEARAFLRETDMNFSLIWPGYHSHKFSLKLTQDVSRIDLAVALCEEITEWLDEMKNKSVAPYPKEYKDWNVKHSRFHLSNLWLWGIRKVKNYDKWWVVDLFVEP